MTTEPSADTIVVGGGLVGAAVAWGLAREGERVTVIDEGDIALRASRGNFGLVWVQTKGKNLPDYARWTRRSADLWPGFAELLEEAGGISPDYSKPGGMILCLSEDELENARALNDRMHNVNGGAGYGAEILDAQQVREALPGLGPEVIGGCYGRHDGHASPLRLLRGLHAGLKAAGARMATDGPVTEVGKDGTGFYAKTAGQTYRGAKLVLAAGHGNTRLAPMVGLDMPIRPEKGQILVTERCRPFLPMPTHVVRQTAEGSIMMGDSHENEGYSTRSTSPPMAQIARNAVRCFPHLARLKILRSWAAVRILSPDGGPVYEESAEMPGAFTVNCHSGVTLAGAHAMALAPMIARGALDPEIDIFSTRRFHGAAH
ncbi:NAD(P)/FAD-dependent oxidoreductase [Mangrovicoccus ximenensis]|uniref:NAD(P)/FAD-dependent oxidoreductase n=1 Tax=Mangrovicoccus ximenensis TaxID=1911570 RepID=UPI000D380C30|nr:FAD-dependent oxidoreductase [Mangrovicoccus ximenensis]